MKRLFSILIAASVTILVLGYALLNYNYQQGRAMAAPEALAALSSDAEVYVDDGEDWLLMKPAAASPTQGVIVYAGAGCDIQGYAEIMRAMASAGYLVAGPKSPFNYAIYDAMLGYSADDIRAAYPEITDWVLVGHSMGGAVAGMYAHAHQDDLKGVIFWDSYPPESNSLADSDLPVMHIHRATLEGEPPQKFTDMQHVYPAHTRWVPVPGGIHMYFGSFTGGGYVETWEPKISNAAAVEIITAATLEGLAGML